MQQRVSPSDARSRAAHSGCAITMLTMLLGAQTPTMTTLAGNGTYGFSGDGGPATAAQVGWPANVAIDAQGNVFFGESETGRSMRRIDKATNTITTVVGGGTVPYPNDGLLATDIALAGYSGVLAVDGPGNVFFLDREPAGGGLIRRRDAVTGIVTTVAGGGAPIIVPVPNEHQSFDYTPTWSGDGGPATSAYLMGVSDIVVDTAGNLFFVDFCVVRRIDAVTGVITRVAGNGEIWNPAYPWGFALSGVHAGDNVAATSAGFEGLIGIALDSLGNLYVSEAGWVGASVRKITAATGIVSTVAGIHTQPGYSGDGGLATAASVGAAGLAVDVEGNLFLASPGDGVVRRVDAATSIITTVAGDGTIGYGGDGGPASVATMAYPFDLAVAPDGTLVITDTDNSRIRQIVSGESFAATTARAAMTEALALPPTSVSTTGSQQAIGTFLDKAAQALQAQNLAQARTKLEMALARTDGWALRGAPDPSGQGEDWVIEMTAATSLYQQIRAALVALQ